MSVKIGIALGGGGARGLAHLGVLKTLEEEGIPIHYITGTSIGAVAGAMYAQNPNVKEVIERVEKISHNELKDQLHLDYLKMNGEKNGSILQQVTQNIKRRIVVNLAQNRKALLKDVCLRETLSNLIDEGRIEDTKIPLGIIASNLNTGEQIEFRKGDILDAVAASSSIPGFFLPVFSNGDLLSDGGITCPVPVESLWDMGAEVTIGVDVYMRNYTPILKINVVEIIARAEMITSTKLSQMMAHTADVAIFPNTRDICWSDFSRFDELIEAGMESTRNSLPEIKRAIQNKLPFHKNFHFKFGNLRNLWLKILPSTVNLRKVATHFSSSFFLR